MKTYLSIRYAVITVILILIQTTFLRFISVGGVTPDAIVLWIVYLALRFGQIHATVAGFVLGLLLDVIGGDFIGLSALSKTVSGFVAGYFYNEEKMEQTLASYRYAVLTMLVSIVHNVIYFSIFVQGSEMPFWRTLFLYGMATTAYTSVLSFLPIFGFSRARGERELLR